MNKLVYFTWRGRTKQPQARMRASLARHGYPACPAASGTTFSAGFCLAALPLEHRIIDLYRQSNFPPETSSLYLVSISETDRYGLAQSRAHVENQRSTL